MAEQGRFGADGIEPLDASVGTPGRLRSAPSSPIPGATGGATGGPGGPARGARAGAGGAGSDPGSGEPLPPEEDEELEGSEYFRSESPAAGDQEPVGAIVPGAATGRRKEAVARVRLRPGTGVLVVNGRRIDEYFPNALHRQVVLAPLRLVGRADVFDVVVRVRGGGITGQAGAVRLGIARALNAIDADAYRPRLKSAGMLTRDARVVERKKAGLKKARKAPQFSKR